MVYRLPLLVRDIHAELMAGCGWMPEDAWRVTLTDALWATRKRQQIEATRMQLQAALILEGFAGKNGSPEVRAIMARLLEPIGRKPTPTQVHGADMMAAMEQSRLDTLAWIERKRAGEHNAKGSSDGQ